jgi:hypothetical protein
MQSSKITSGMLALIAIHSDFSALEKPAQYSDTDERNPTP